MMWGYGSGWWPWMMVGGTFVSLLVLAVLVWGVVVLSRGSRPTDGPSGPATSSPDTPEAILERRLARGEIDVDTFRATRDALGHRPR